MQLSRVPGRRSVAVHSRLGRLALTAVVAGGAFAGALVTQADADGLADTHAQHHAGTAPDTKRSVAHYRIPDVRLVRDDDRPVSLREEIDDGRPVVLSFIYTTCTTICPLTSATLAELQARLRATQDRVHLVSISIDPEQDTPARLREYAKKYGAGPEWQHYTGTLAASIAAQQAFAVYQGDKMSHTPVTLIRVSPASEWVRIDGFVSASQMLAELPHAVVSR